jgi:hypothetical protein
MTLKGQRRSITKLTDEEHKKMTDSERVEFDRLARCRLSDKFAKNGDPRNWKNPLSQGQKALESMIHSYSDWLRGDWNDTRGVTPPPNTYQLRLG